MLLGINLAHGASASLITRKGQVIAALEEERVSRVKNHVGFPLGAITRIISDPEFSVKKIDEVVFGNTNKYSLGEAQVAVASLENNPSNPPGLGLPVRPGINFAHLRGQTGTQIIENLVKTTFSELNIDPDFQSIWMQHHDSHLGCSLGAGSIERTLLISLDGAGDGQSGAIAIAQNRRMSRLYSISMLDSIGSLYEAVTRRYNFTPGKHEGKITGLAAFGSYSKAVEVLLQFVSVDNGKLSINYAKKKWKTELTFLLRRLDIPNSLKLSLKEIIDAASSETSEYADLAFAVQKVLEDSVLEIAQFWLEKTSTERLSVSGGVFANVKLNQRLAEHLPIQELSVFPNMGDAGLSVGGVWAYLASNNALDSGELYSSMKLAPGEDFQGRNLPDEVQLQELKDEPLAKLAAELISSGKFVAIHHGKMEFGPRALGARSLLLDPRNRTILVTANARLRRTEFMPFAPVVLASRFQDFFEPLKPNLSYSDMTITCRVRDDKREMIPAVTHVDGTARPQVISDDNSIYSKVLEEFNKITGIPVLVNTSFNVHEEPINYSLENSISCLVRGAVDYIIVSGGMISLKTPDTRS
jgi:carbamoyltransferase